MPHCVTSTTRLKHSKSPRVTRLRHRATSCWPASQGAAVPVRPPGGCQPRKLGAGAEGRPVVGLSQASCPASFSTNSSSGDSDRLCTAPLRGRWTLLHCPPDECTCTAALEGEQSAHLATACTRRALRDLDSRACELSTVYRGARLSERCVLPGSSPNGVVQLGVLPACMSDKASGVNTQYRLVTACSLTTR